MSDTVRDRAGTRPAEDIRVPVVIEFDDEIYVASRRVRDLGETKAVVLLPGGKYVVVTSWYDQGVRGVRSAGVELVEAGKIGDRVVFESAVVVDAP